MSPGVPQWDRATVSRLLPVADIFFLSSKIEGFSNILLEAIDADCIILTTDVQGIRDLTADLPEEYRKILEKNPKLGFVLDTTHALENNELKEIIREVGKRIIYVHLSGFVRNPQIAVTRATRRASRDDKALNHDRQQENQNILLGHCLRWCFIWDRADSFFQG